MPRKASAVKRRSQSTEERCPQNLLDQVRVGPACSELAIGWVLARSKPRAASRTWLVGHALPLPEKLPNLAVCFCYLDPGNNCRATAGNALHAFSSGAAVGWDRCQARPFCRGQSPSRYRDPPVCNKSRQRF